VLLWFVVIRSQAFLDGATPFYNQKRVAKFADDFNDAINEATRSMTVEYGGGNFSPKAEDLARALLTRDPAQRLGAKGWREVEKHAFFLDFDFEALRNATMMPPFVPEETLNAKDSGAIGSHDEEKTVQWDRADEKQFEQWDYLNDARFEQEAIQSLEWAKEHGDLRDKKKANSSTCTML
jgi:hypothetical protein